MRILPDTAWRVDMSRKRGVLIAVEGIDQAGKRTQAQFLAKEIRKAGFLVSVRSFPDYGTPLGKLLKAYLQNRIRLPPHAVHLLYAANKWEAASGLARQLKRGEVLVVNRYSPSNMAYGAAHGLSRKWLASLETGLPKPDAVVLLDIPPRMSHRRKIEGRDIHEGNLPYLAKVRREYLNLSKKNRWKIIDGSLDTKRVRMAVWSKVAPILRQHRHGHHN
jgi:dTMP kinase